MPYNTRYVFVAFTVPSAANFNNNAENLDFLKTQVDTTIVNGRLTLESGVPISTSDQTAKTTLYFTPYLGNRIGLKSGSSWDLYSFTEKSLPLSGYIKGVVYDIFGYLSSGALALESLAWKKVTASNSPTSGSAKTINVSDTGDLAVGREVTIKDGSNSEITTITALVANTSITVDLANSYTTPDVYGFNTRATDLTLDEGKWVKSGDATRRYLGTIRITSTTGQCEDSLQRRLISNYAQPVLRQMHKSDSTATWNANDTSFGYARGQTSNRLELLLHKDGLQPIVRLEVLAYPQSSSNLIEVGIGVDSSSEISGINSWIYNTAIPILLRAALNSALASGYHYLAWLERYTAGTGAEIKGGDYSAIQAWHWC